MLLRIPVPLVLLLLQLIPSTFATAQLNDNNLRLDTRHPVSDQRNTDRISRRQKDTPKPQCHPFGVCEPCPKNLLHEPFCQPFGNRRLVHCLPSNTTDISDVGPDDEVPAWESCGRIPSKERADFFEFVLCNVIFAALAIAGVLIRSEKMRVVRARRLAARIGVTLRRASWAPGTLVAGDPANEGLLRERGTIG